MAITNGTTIQFHAKVNIDPLGSHCSLCGGRTKSPLWFPIDWDSKVDCINADANDVYSDKIWGWFPVGSECAKKFDANILIKR